MRPFTDRPRLFIDFAWMRIFPSAVASTTPAARAAPRGAGRACVAGIRPYAPATTTAAATTPIREVLFMRASSSE